MYKDIINYQLAENISEEHLLKIATQVVDTWMKHQIGFLKWEIHKNNDGHYTDIVYWKSQEDAKRSEKDMVNIPSANDWLSCYQEGSISYQNINMIRSF